MTAWLHPDAEAELGDAAVYYATHASRTIAEAFLAEFERVRETIVENPLRGPEVGQGLRTLLFERFPYAAIYGIHEHHGVVIYAIAHQHREPGYWAERA